MHVPELILSLTGGTAAALLFGYLTHRIGLSPIVGYLVAGVIVGPYTPGFVADEGLTSQFAEIGVILMMFGVGLQFHLKDLLAVRHVAITGALCQSTVATILGAIAARAFGWSWAAGLVFGLALAVASTVVLTRVLVDNRDLHTPTGRIAIGWLVVEDIFTVLVLVLLPAIFQTSEVNTGVLMALLVALVKVAILLAFAFLVGTKLIPWVLNGVARTNSRELFTLTILVLALGIAVGSAMMFGTSMALGAFLAGMIVGQSEFSFRAASDALPMRDAFAVLFFVSVGMLLNPASLVQALGLFFATVAIVLVGKPLAAFFIVTIMGHGSRIAFGVSVALAQIGEFSLILATVADQLNIFQSNATDVLVAASIASITLNPMLYRLVPSMESALRGLPKLWHLMNRSPAVVRISEEHHESPSVQGFQTVVVGYGPIGQTVARLLRDGDVEPIVIETNIDTVRRVRSAGYRTVYGDAARRDVLEASGISTAVGIVICGPTTDQVAEIIRIARQINPELRILARSNYLRETLALREAGATEVFSGEGEVALSMTEYILTQLGATAEQMDRERIRVREEVFRLTQPGNDK